MPAATQRNFLRAFTFLLLSFSMPASVLAATLMWQGPYAGAYLGGGFGNINPSTNAGSATSTSYFSTSADINAVNNAGTWTNNAGTVIAGIQAGHDWGWKQLVYGVAVDYGMLPLSSSSTTSNTYPGASDQYSVYTSMQTNWLFTFRGRAGYQPMLPVPTLLYLTGGMAITQLKIHNSFNDNSALAGTGSSTTAQNQIGWTAGVGIEIAAFNHTSVDFEYLYVNVPSVKSMGTISNANGGFGIPPQSMNSPFSTSADFYANIFKIGLTYRFDE